MWWILVAIVVVLEIAIGLLVNLASGLLPTAWNWVREPAFVWASLAFSAVALMITTLVTRRTEGKTALANGTKDHFRAINPYLLLETGRAIGRATEKSEIAQFVREPSSDRVLIALGTSGIGKSALAWDSWKSESAASSTASMFWYTFQGSNFDAFLGEFGDFLGLSRPSASGILSALQHQETRIYLDGLERCLLCYLRPLDVPEEVDENLSWSEEEMSFATGEMKTFFLGLLDIPSVKVVASSRLLPTDYLLSGSGMQPGVRVLPVGELTADDSRRFVRAIGVNLRRKVEDDLIGALSGHPLALQLAARAARGSTLSRPATSEWMVDRGYDAENGAGAVGIRRALFIRQVSALGSSSRQVLAILGAIGGIAGPIDQARIAKGLNLDDQEFANVKSELLKSGLCAATDDSMGTHLLVATTASELLTPEEVIAAGRIVRDSFAGRYSRIRDSGYASWATANSGSDRKEAIALCRSLIRLGDFVGAAAVYRADLMYPLNLMIGGHFEAVELLGRIRQGLLTVAEMNASGRLAWVETELTHHLCMTAKVSEARAISQSWQKPSTFALLYSKAEVELYSGNIPDALSLAWDAMHIARECLSRAMYIDYRGMSVLAGKWESDRAGPSSEIQQSSALISHLLFILGESTLACNVLAFALHDRSRHHRHCVGCTGLLLKAMAVLMAHDPEGKRKARSVLTAGEELQSRAGRDLDGMIHEVMFTVAGGTSFHRDRLLRAATRSGSMLFDLALRANTGRPASRVEAEKSITGIGAQAAFALKTSDRLAPSAAKRVARIRSFLRSTPTAAGDSGSYSAFLFGDFLIQPEPDPDPEIEALEGPRPRPPGKREQKAFGMVAEFIERRLAANEESQAGLVDRPSTSDAINLRQGLTTEERSAWTESLQIDPVQAVGWARLAIDSHMRDDHDVAVSQAIRACKIEPCYGYFKLLMDMAGDDRMLLEVARREIRALAENDFSAAAGFLVLANLEWKLDRPKEAGRMHDLGLETESVNYGSGVAGDPTETEIRLAHYLGSRTPSAIFRSTYGGHPEPQRTMKRARRLLSPRSTANPDRYEIGRIVRSLRNSKARHPTTVSELLRALSLLEGTRPGLMDLLNSTASANPEEIDGPA